MVERARPVRVGRTGMEAMPCSLRIVTSFQLRLETSPTNVLCLWAVSYTKDS